MKTLKLTAAVLGLVALSGCATFDRMTVADNSMTARNYVPARTAPADPATGAGAPGGAGAGATR